MKRVNISGKMAWHIGNYKISKSAINKFYKNYISKLQNIEKDLNKELKSSVNIIKKNLFKNTFIYFYIKRIIKSIFFIHRQYSLYKKIKLKIISSYIYDK